MNVDLSDADDTLGAAVTHPRPLVAVVSSRVGHDSHRHRRLSQQIAASLHRMRRDGETALVVEGTAVEPWLTHAAGVFQVPILRLPRRKDRDRVAIAIADRVDAAYVRRRGKMTSLLSQRARMGSGLVRVAIDGSRVEREAVWELLDAGAVGRYLSPEAEPPREPACLLLASTEESELGGELLDADQIDWTTYLVHCTRAAAGPWPGQTWTQYRDDLLLADPASASRDCIDSLCRIVGKRRLVAGAITSDRAFPVVCFSAVALPELLARRVYRSHLHRWDYEPYGIAIKRTAAMRLGISPVIYGDGETKRQLPTEQAYRFQSCGTTRDWTLEQEWRSDSDIDLNLLDASESFIFVPDETARLRVSLSNRGRWPLAIVD